MKVKKIFFFIRSFFGYNFENLTMNLIMKYEDKFNLYILFSDSLSEKSIKCHENQFQKKNGTSERF